MMERAPKRSYFTPAVLRISKKADYAVFLLGTIARQGAHPGGSSPDTVVSAQEIARQAKLNKSVVANLLKDFARSGLLESVRGLKGGYRLTKRPEDITLHEILEVVEGQFHLVECISNSPDNPCSLFQFCPSKRPMQHVHERVRKLFNEIRLYELCDLHGTTPTR